LPTSLPLGICCLGLEHHWSVTPTYTLGCHASPNKKIYPIKDPLHATFYMVCACGAGTCTTWLPRKILSNFWQGARLLVILKKKKNVLSELIIKIFFKIVFTWHKKRPKLKDSKNFLVIKQKPYVSPFKVEKKKSFLIKHHNMKMYGG
jgi:hypothetical protein